MSSPIGGISTSSTSDETILPKAAPMITPTAKSRTLPRMTNALNSFNMDRLLGCRFRGADYNGCGPTLDRGNPAGLTRTQNEYGSNQAAQDQDQARDRE